MTPEKLRDFAERAEELLRELGYTECQGERQGETAKQHGRACQTISKPTHRSISSAPAIGFALSSIAATWRSRTRRATTGLIKVACRLRDFGLRPQTASELLLEPGGWNEHCRPPWEPEELAVKVRNAYKYGKNRPVLMRFLSAAGIGSAWCCHSATSTQANKPLSGSAADGQMSTKRFPN